MKFGNVINTLVAIGALATGSAYAAPAYYFGSAPTANGTYPAGCPDVGNANCAPLAASNDFASNVLMTAVENFERQSPSLLSSLAGNAAAVLQTVGGGGATAGMLSQIPPTGSALGGAFVAGTSSPTGRFNTTGGAATGGWFETDRSFAIQLGSSVQGFGFFGTDFNDFAGTLSIRLLLGDVVQYADVFANYNAATQTPGQGSPNGSLAFFGFTSDDKRFDRIEFGVNQRAGTTFGDEDFLGFDDVVVGNLRVTGPAPSPMPEPGSLALVGLALFTAAYARKARKAA